MFTAGVGWLDSRHTKKGAAEAGKIISLSLSLSCTHTNTYTHSLSLFISHCHLLPLFLSLSLSPRLSLTLGMVVCKIGGPAYRIGMGGGAASSRSTADDEANSLLDFDAVQRGDAEMENRMNRWVRVGSDLFLSFCLEIAEDNPIISILISHTLSLSQFPLPSLSLYLSTFLFLSLSFTILTQLIEL
jgi:hypothetical protein